MNLQPNQFVTESITSASDAGSRTIRGAVGTSIVEACGTASTSLRAIRKVAILADLEMASILDERIAELIPTSKKGAK